MWSTRVYLQHVEQLSRSDYKQLEAAYQEENSKGVPQLKSDVFGHPLQSPNMYLWLLFEFPFDNFLLMLSSPVNMTLKVHLDALASESSNGCDTTHSKLIRQKFTFARAFFMEQKVELLLRISENQTSKIPYLLRSRTEKKQTQRTHDGVTHPSWTHSGLIPLIWSNTTRLHNIAARTRCGDVARSIQKRCKRHKVRSDRMFVFARLFWPNSSTNQNIRSSVMASSVCICNTDWG